MRTIARQARETRRAAKKFVRGFAKRFYNPLINAIVTVEKKKKNDTLRIGDRRSSCLEVSKPPFYGFHASVNIVQQAENIVKSLGERWRSTPVIKAYISMVTSKTKSMSRCISAYVSGYCSTNLS